MLFPIGWKDRRVEVKRTITYTVLMLLAFGFTMAGRAASEDASEIMKRSHLAYYYAADDGLADVRMTIIDKRGKKRVKEFTMLRMDEEEGGKQKYYTYFKKPSDKSRVLFPAKKSPKVPWVTFVEIFNRKFSSNPYVAPSKRPME